MRALLILLAVAVSAFAEQKPKSTVACFKVVSMTRADSEHYWATYANACGYTIESVYVMVNFLDGARQIMDNGVWSLHYLNAGAKRMTRFSVPAGAVDFHSVKLMKITANWEEALAPSKKAAVTIEQHPTGFVGDPGPQIAFRH